MQENLSQQNQQEQEEPAFELFMAEPHFLRPVIPDRYTGHPRDVNYDIRPTIIRSLDVPLTDVYKKIVDKKLDEALFYFYKVIFPEAIHTIIKIETKYMGLKETDEYISLLVKYFYLAMNEKTSVANEYTSIYRDDSYHDRSHYVYNSDPIYIDILKSRMTLYSGRAETKTALSIPGIDAEIDRISNLPLPWLFAGNNYREQIIKHVALFWELFMVYHAVESRLAFFTIPEKMQYWPGDIVTATPEAFNTWTKMPLEEKMVFEGISLFQSIKSLEELDYLD